MSAIYFDVLKDRLYTFRQDAPARRASQRVLHETLLSLTKLMAPILSFTAEEIWQSIPEQQRKAPSVHLTQFPKSDPRYKDVELEKRWERLLHIRTVVQAGVEVQRREKIIRGVRRAHTPHTGPYPHPAFAFKKKIARLAASPLDDERE